MKKFFFNDKNILILIVINAIIIFLTGFKFTDSLNYFLLIIDQLISTLFILELIFKLREYGYKKFFKDSWNIFDFLLIVISIPSLLIFLFDINMIDMSYLLVFRTLRLLKVFRFFKFIPDIEKLINGLKRAMKASVLILICFVLYIFTIGILSHSLFGYSELFADPATSIYSVLKIFTLEGWYEFPDQLVTESGMLGTFFIRLYFIIILLSGGVFGLSIVNSIFIDAMVSDNNDELEMKVDKLNEMVEELLKINKL